MKNRSISQSNNTKQQLRCKRRRKIKIKMPHKARRVKSQATQPHHTTNCCMLACTLDYNNNALVAQPFDCRGNNALTRRDCPIYDPNKVAALQLADTQETHKDAEYVAQHK